MSSCFLKGLFWSPHLAFKNTEHGWINPDAFSNRSHGNMEDSFFLPSIILFQRYSDKEQEIPSIFCSEPIVVYSTRRKIKSVTREIFEMPWCLKTFGMWEAILYWWYLFKKQLEQNHVNIIDWEIWCWFWFFWFQLCVCISNTQNTWKIAIILWGKQYIYSAPLQTLS